MFGRRMKLRIKLVFLKKKREIFERRYKRLRKKEAKAYMMFKKASTNYFYAVQNMYPERTWEMRGEREFYRD